MAPKKRSLSNSDLTGTNIKTVKRKDCTDYYYRMPDNSYESLGKDRAAAIEAAITLNQHLRPSGDIANRIINKPKQTSSKPLDSLDKLINEFKEFYLPEKNHTRKTLEGKLLKLEQYLKEWGNHSTSTMTTRTIAEYLNPLTPNAYIKHRALLNQLFQFAIHQGYRDTNPVTATMVKTAPKRTRHKHTIEGYQAIHDIAPDWLQRAMDIALRSLQRRGDLTRLHRDHIDMQKGTIRILQRKSRNYKKPVYIEIVMGEELRSAVQASLSSGVPCPYLLHYRPTRMTQERIYSKDHPFSVTDDNLTKKFSKYRDMSGVYDHIPTGKRPSFHDLRGLGSYLYEKAGFDKNYIMALTGHASEAMLNHYIEGHEKALPVTVSADLKFTGKRGE